MKDCLPPRIAKCAHLLAWPACDLANLISGTSAAQDGRATFRRP